MQYLHMQVDVPILFGHTLWRVPHPDCTLVSGFTGPLVEVDAAFFARKAIELAALPSLRELATKTCNLGSRRTLLNVVCAAVAAFDLSPFTLPLPELVALVDTLAHLYEGTEGHHEHAILHQSLQLYMLSCTANTTYIPSYATAVSLHSIVSTCKRKT